MNSEKRLHELIARYHIGQINDEEFLELESALNSTSKARQLFHRACRVDSSLRGVAEAGQSGPEAGVGEKVVTLHRRPLIGKLAAIAAVLVLSAITITIAAQKRIVATIISSEDAAWESSLPTVEGSSLAKGSLRLADGIATVRFDSGVELTLEAPTRLFLKGERRASVVYGTVLVNAGGTDEFLLETEFGQVAVTDGEFVAKIGKKGRSDRFEVVSGKMVVSHDASRDALKLEVGQMAVLSKQGIESSEIDDLPEPAEQFAKGVRLRSEDRTATFIRNNKPYKWTRPEMLTMKKSRSGHGFDQYAVVGFNLESIDPENIDDVVLRLNFVPSGKGLVSRLPKQIRFSVYGLVNTEKRDWAGTDLWEDAPSVKDGRLVGSFEMSRSQLSGGVAISNEDMSRFVASNTGGSVSYIVVCDSFSKEGPGQSYTHAFASNSHPESVGPVLEVFLKEPGVVE